MGDLKQKILNHPKNKYVLITLGTYINLNIDDVDDTKLYTHPDLVGFLWGHGYQNSPDGIDPRAVISQPALVNPASGVIYGLARGTDTLLLRLPPEELKPIQDKQSLSTEIELRKYGLDWAFIRPVWSNQHINELVRSAYDNSMD